MSDMHQMSGYSADFSTELVASEWHPERDHLAVVRHADGVVELILSNPQRRNAMSGAMTAAWSRLIPVLAADRSVRAVLVRGADGFFCSGGDTSWIGSEPDASVADLRERMLAFYRVWLGIRSVPVPTMAVLEGAAVGAGACLALACDIRWATPSARLSVPFTLLGMHAGMAATWLLPEVAGMAVARDLLLTGRSVSGDELLRLGLATRLVDENAIVAEAQAAAVAIAATAPVATRLTVAALRDGGHATYDAAVQWEALAQSVTLTTADLQEGLVAAKERRSPRFTGR